MAGAWDLAEGVMEAITFAVEYAIFTFFIYEESMQIICREFLTNISSGKNTLLKQEIRTSFDFVMAGYSRDFSNYGIVALYACNAYSSYLYSCMMVKEWSYLYLGWDRLEYSFPRTGLF